MEDWKKRLTEARVKKFPVRSRFSEAVGVSHATTTDWEKSVDDGGIETLAGKNLTKVCDVLGITAKWLLFGSEEKIYKRPHPINSDWLDMAVCKAMIVLREQRIKEVHLSKLIEYYYEEYADNNGAEMSKEKENRIVRMIANFR